MRVKGILVVRPRQGNREESEKEDIKIYLQFFQRTNRNIFKYKYFPSLFFACRENAFRLNVFPLPRFVLNLDLNVLMLFIYDVKSAFASSCFSIILFHHDFVLQIKCKIG